MRTKNSTGSRAVEVTEDNIRSKEKAETQDCETVVKRQRWELEEFQETAQL